MRLPLLVAALAAAPLLALAGVAAGASAPVQADAQEDVPVRPAEGDVAPAVRLNDQDGKAVALGGDRSADSTAWTVLAFFPKAATPG